MTPWDRPYNSLLGVKGLGLTLLILFQLTVSARGVLSKVVMLGLGVSSI